MQALAKDGKRLECSEITLKDSHLLRPNVIELVAILEMDMVR